MKDGFRIIDSDLHVMEPSDIWEKRIDPAFRDRAPKFVGRKEGGTFGMPLEVEGKLYPNWYPKTPEGGQRDARNYARLEVARGSHPLAEGQKSGFDAPSHLHALDIEGIDVAFLYPTAAHQAQSIDGLDPHLSAAICRAYNDWLAEYCKYNPQRLVGVATLPLHDPHLAADEARRATRELGLKAVIMRPNYINGHNLNDRYFDPLYAELERLGAPLALHEGAGAGHPTIATQRFYGQVALVHAMTHPIEMMMGSASLLYGGVLERFPKLKVAFLESGSSWMPYWLYRLDEHLEVWGDKDAWVIPNRPSEYFKRQCFIACDSDEKQVKYVVEDLGDDNILFSSDYPHPDSPYPFAVQQFLALPGLDRQSKKKILWDNAVRFYGMEPGEHGLAKSSKKLGLA